MREMIKGRLFVDCVEQAAKKLSRHTKKSVIIELQVGHFVRSDGEQETTSEISIYNSADDERYVLPFGSTDLRHLDDFIEIIIRFNRGRA